MRFLYLLTALVVPYLAHSKPIFIYINFGDDGGYWEDKLGPKQDQAAELYAKMGYEVKTIKPSANIKVEIEKTFASIGPSEEVVIQTIGHGLLQSRPADKARYPALKYAPNKYDTRPTSFLSFTNGKYPESALKWREGFSDFEERQSEIALRNSIGPGDLEKYIKSYQEKNPNASVRVEMQQCFSGNAVRHLADKGIVAYSATWDSEIAGMRKNQGKEYVFIDIISEETRRADAESPRPSQIEIFNRARKRWNRFSTESDGLGEVPWTPIDGAIANWCANHATDSAPRAGDLSPVLLESKRTADQTLHFEVEAHAIYSAKNGCRDKLNKAKDLLPALKAARGRAFAQIGVALRRVDFARFQLAREQLVAELGEFSDFAKVKTEADFKAYKSRLINEFESTAECKIGHPFVCTDQAFDAMKILTGEAWEEAVPNSCRGVGDDACLKWIAGLEKHPVRGGFMSMSTARRVEREVGLCQDLRHQEAKRCHERFWKFASRDDLSKLEKLAAQTQIPLGSDLRAGAVRIDPTAEAVRIQK